MCSYADTVFNILRNRPSVESGISLEGMMLKLKLQYFGQPHAKSWLIGKVFDAGRDLGQEKKGTTEDEMAGWHHGLDGRESEWTPGVGDGQGGLACCDSWGRNESDKTERLNWTDKAEVDVFLELSCFLDDATHVSNLISGPSAKGQKPNIEHKYNQIEPTTC